MIKECLVKNLKHPHKYCPAAIGLAFSTKLEFDAKIQNRAFSNITNLGLCCSLVALNINCKSV